jgi:hypothetical protein
MTRDELIADLDRAAAALVHELTNDVSPERAKLLQAAFESGEFTREVVLNFDIPLIVVRLVHRDGARR